MEEKNVIKNEKQEIHKISKELEDRMIYEEQCIIEVEDTKKRRIIINSSFFKRLLCMKVATLFES